jgi:hypothetical protein
MKVGTDRDMPPSACTNCGHVMDVASSVSENDNDNNPQPEAGAFTICITCGHIMAFADDLMLRDLTDEEIVMVAGDKRIIAVQQARAHVLRDRAYCEDFVRENIKRMNQKLPSQETINSVVDKVLASVPKPPRPPR